MLKMTFAFLVILVSVGGSLCDKCDDKRKLCDKNMIPRFFPDSTEDLLNACQNIRTFGNCIVHASEGCEVDEENLTPFQKAIDYLESVCEEDNPTFKVISSNIACIAQVAETMSGSCIGNMSEKNIDILNEHMWPHFEFYWEELIDCLNGFVDITCYYMTFGYFCGQDVGDAVEELLTKLNPDYQQCSEEILEELTPFREIYKTVLLEELQLQNSHERKK